jgi:hypothetical protein
MFALVNEEAVGRVLSALQKEGGNPVLISTRHHKSLQL